MISAGVQSALNGTSFGGALREAIVGDLAALGANQIGTHLTGVERAVAHAALGAISAELTGKDALAGAIGALTSALAAAPLDEALGLTGEARKTAVTALAMLAGGMASDALGHDPLEAVELQKLRERCILGRCSDAERTEMRRLEALDRTRNEQLEAACRNPGSLECQNAYLDLARALSSYGGKRIEPGSVGARELGELANLEFQFRRRIVDPATYNAVAGAAGTLAQGLAASVELALLTLKAAFGSTEAQDRLGQLVEAAGEFLEHPVDATERAIKATLDQADQLAAAGRIDEAQRLRAGLVTDGVLAITGAGAVVLRGSGKVLGTLARGEGSAFDSAVLTKDEVQRIVDQNRIENRRTADGTASDFPREIRTSSGIVIRANPDKTTTILGSFRKDMQYAIKGQLDLQLSDVDLGSPRPGSFNILNVPDSVAKRLGDERFWNEVNKPFLDAAIDRGDVIVLATKPDRSVMSRTGDDGLARTSAFGREYDYLRSRGFSYDGLTGQMVLEKKQ